MSAPLFVLSTERSGSTLTRILLDTHSQICSPGELALGRLSMNLYNIIKRTRGEVLGLAEGKPLDDFCFKETRRIIDDIMNGYANAKGKPIWCEKAPHNVMYLEELILTFPDARFICLYRNCLDVVNSCLDGSRIGFMDELTEYVVKSPGNLVSAMIDSWVDKTKRIFQFETRFPSKCHRIKYEDLAINPQHTLQPLFRFLGLAWEPEIITKAFQVRHDSGGGDPKVLFTRKVNSANIGKGSTIPYPSLEPDRLEAMNALLRRLDYPQVGPNWNQIPNPYRPAQLDDVAQGVKNIEEVFTRHIPNRIKENASFLQGAKISVKFRITGDEESTWTVDLRGLEPRIVNDGSLPAQLEVTMNSQVCLDISNEKTNPLAAYGQGDIGIQGGMEYAAALRFFF